MFIAFIYSLEVALIALLATLAFRIHSLYSVSGYCDQRQAENIIDKMMHGQVASNKEYNLKMDSLKQAQAFSGMQLIDIKRNYGDLSQENLAWLREAVSLYLIGAIDMIGKELKCSTQVRKEIALLVLKSNLHMTSEAAQSYYSEALYRKLSSDNDLTVRSGAKAAKAWLTKDYIPKEMSLASQLDEWGIFA
jgi:hypothetical protein